MSSRAVRTIIAVALVAGVATPVLAPARPSVAISAEPQADPDVAVAYNINARHDGHLSSGVQRPPLTRKWTRDLGGEVSYPVIVDGKVFVTSAIGGGTLFALDATTGREVWPPVAAGGGMLTFGEGRIFALAGNGMLRAFDAQTGSQAWAVQLTEQWVFDSAPTYHNGRVFASGAGFGGTLFSVSALDGRVLWKQTTAGGDNSTPTVSDTAVYVSYSGEEHYAFDPASGALIWHDSGGYVAGGGRTAVLANGRLWTRDHFGGPSLSLDEKTGAVMGSYRGDAAPSFHGEVGFFMTGRVLEARNASTQAILWAFAGDGYLTANPLVVNGYVYVGSMTGQLWALDEATGVPAWSDNVGAPTLYAGLGAGQGLIVVPAASLLVAYSGASSPTPIHRIASVHGSSTTPAVGNDPTPAIVVSGVVAGATVGILKDGTLAATRAVPPSSTTVTFNLVPSATDVVLAGDRRHTLTAVVIDGAGNRSTPSEEFLYHLDTTPPAPPRVASVHGATTGPVTGNDPTPSIVVSGVLAGDTVQIHDGSFVRGAKTVPPAATTVTFNATSVAADVELPSGDYSLTATTNDPAGNASSPSPPFVYTYSRTFAGDYHALDPTRILDTRDGTGGVSAAIGPAETVPVTVAGRVGVPAAGVSAVVLNVTVTQPTSAGFLTLFPSGTRLPLAANLNFTPGQTVPNLVVVKVGADGKVALFNSGGSTHVVLDVAGWYSDLPENDGGRFQPLVPARILDTRVGAGGAVRLAPGASLDLQVAGRGGVPASGAVAAVLNVAVTGPTAAGFLTVHPTGQPRPLAANLNFVAGETASNRVVAKLGAGGRVTIFNNAGSADVVVDVNGWYTDVAETRTSGTYYALEPTRLLDTRYGTGGIDGKRAANSTVDVQITARGGVPASGVSAVVLNVAVSETTAPGYLTVFPAGTAKPLVSDLNYASAATRPNLVVVKVGAAGKVSLFTSAGTHVVFDVAGWYAT